MRQTRRGKDARPVTTERLPLPKTEKLSVSDEKDDQTVSLTILSLIYPLLI
jgi:hypothetical protein